MPFLKRFFLLLFCLLSFKSAYSQNTKENVLTRKYAPSALKEDAVILKNVILKMHPVIGIYRPRDYYVDLFDSFINSLNDSLTEKEFRIKTKILLDELHCGHTEALSSREYLKASNREKPGFSPYVFMPLNNKLYVLASVNRKKDTLLKRGTEITRLNGIPTDSMLRVCGKLITTDGFNATGKEHYLKIGFNSYYPSLFGRADTFEVEYKKGDSVKLLRYPPVKIQNIPSIPLGPKDDSLFIVYKRARIKHRFLDSANKTMLVRVHSFSRRKFKKAYRRIFRKLDKNNSENLIIDLRYNGGGSLENSYRLLSYMLDKPQEQTLWTGIKKYPFKNYTRGNIWFRSMRLGFRLIAKKRTVNDTDHFTYTIRPRKKHHYNNKVYVLINGGSFSASCLVAAYLKNNGKATFVGDETSGAAEGCNAGITPYYKLPNTNVRIRVPAFRIVHDVTPAITGRGIIPDYKVEYGIMDILYRRDLELEKVKALIR
jgi:hypothetical protein